MEKTPRLQAFQRPLSLLNLCKISLLNAQRDLPLSLDLVRKVVSFLLVELKITTDEIIIHFVTESKICALHKEYFNDPSPTDCITFPIDPFNLEKDCVNLPSPTAFSRLKKKDKIFHILGEAFICPKTAFKYAKRHGIDPHTECYRYIIHCLLHLIGYNDLNPADRVKMKRKEKSCLTRLMSFLALLPNSFAP